MVDFSNTRKEEEIKAKLKELKRQGRNMAVEFPPIEIGDFILQIRALDKPQKWTYGPWIPKELEKLKRITELDKVSVKIFEKRPKTDIVNAVQVYSDKRFKEKSWTPKFVQTVGNLHPDELVEVIRFLQVLTELVAFI